MRQTLLAVCILLTLVFAVGCGPQGEGASIFRLSALERADIEKVIEANITTTFEASAEAKIADRIDKVEAKLADTIDNRVTQTVRDFQGKQNIGMFAGDSIYILILSVVVVASVFVFFFYLLRGKSKERELLISAITGGVAQAKRTGMGNGNEAGINQVLTEIKKYAEKAGVSRALNERLVNDGKL